MNIKPLTWTFIGFTFDSTVSQGTFFVNDIYGYHNTDNGVPQETMYFTYQTDTWFTSALKNSFRVGSKIFQNGTTQDENFCGQMSCLQIYRKHVSIAQFNQLQKCYNSYKYRQTTLCPMGFIYYRRYCFLLSTNKETFANAEATCALLTGFTSIHIYLT